METERLVHDGQCIVCGFKYKGAQIGDSMIRPFPGHSDFPGHEDNLGACADPIAKKLKSVSLFSNYNRAAPTIGTMAIRLGGREDREC